MKPATHFDNVVSFPNDDDLARRQDEDRNDATTDPLVVICGSGLAALLLGTAGWGFRSAGMLAIAWPMLALAGVAMLLFAATALHAAGAEAVAVGWRQRQLLRQELHAAHQRTTFLSSVLRHAVHLPEPPSWERFCERVIDLLAVDGAPTGALVIRVEHDEAVVVGSAGSALSPAAGWELGSTFRTSGDISSWAESLSEGFQSFSTTAVGSGEAFEHLVVFCEDPVAEGLRPLVADALDAFEVLSHHPWTHLRPSGPT